MKIKATALLDNIFDETPKKRPRLEVTLSSLNDGTFIYTPNIVSRSSFILM